MDGLGVGSFEYGWLRENVISADVVLVGGERREVSSEDLGTFLAPGSSSGLVVGAKLKTRYAQSDVPFAAEYKEVEDLANAVAGVAGARLPLWHLAFLNPPMSRARALGEGYLLFGAFPREQETKVAGPLDETVEASRGRLLGAAEAYRAWGERFFPVAPSYPTPTPTDRTFMRIEDVSEALYRHSSKGYTGHSSPLRRGAPARL